MSLAVREPFPEDGVIECVAEAYDGAPEPCHNVEAEANLMFPFVSSLPEKASGGVVKAKLLTLESPGISTWSITGDWNYWPLPVFAQRVLSNFFDSFPSIIYIFLLLFPLKLGCQSNSEDFWN